MVRAAIRFEMLRTTSVLRCTLAALLLVASAAAQTPKLDKRPYKDEQNGYSFRPPAEWDATPVPPERKGLGLLHQLQNGRSRHLELMVFKLAPERVGAERPDLGAFLRGLFAPSLRPRDEDLEKDETVAVGPLEAHHRTWHPGTTAVDTWTFTLPEFDVALVFLVSLEDKSAKRWLQLYRRSAKTFKTIEAEDVGEVSSSSSYADQLAYHEAEAARTPGWRALPTPSEEFILKTSSDNDRFLEEVIERLELSRELYERDFPPPDDFDAVSVVRVCGSLAEFQQYGRVGAGVAGYFNPNTIELVLYDAKETDRNATYAVMSHEAFHQYCFFLFGRSEAHRWFDEGHGDYYGGVEFKRGRAKITPRMPGGLDRLPVIRQMLRDGTQAPLREHLNYDHMSWQNQGPTNVSCYAQSWSIVYMLREGMLGKVSRKYWRDEYAQILPAYVETLNAGFRDAYEDQRRERLAEAAAEAGGEGRSVALGGPRKPLDPEVKQRIWEEAMAAAWAPIDLDAFEESWRAYVLKGLK